MVPVPLKSFFALDHELLPFISVPLPRPYLSFHLVEPDEIIWMAESELGELNVFKERERERGYKGEKDYPFKWQ